MLCEDRVIEAGVERVVIVDQGEIEVPAPTRPRNRGLDAHHHTFQHPVIVHTLPLDDRAMHIFQKEWRRRALEQELLANDHELVRVDPHATARVLEVER